MYWCRSSNLYFLRSLCQNISKLNYFDAINESAPTNDEMLLECLLSPKFCKKSMVRAFTAFGMCYTFNMQGFNTIFNTEVIHDDFKCYLRNTYEDASDIQWTAEKGYETIDTNFPERAKRGMFTFMMPLLSTLYKGNICTLDSFRIFFHKTNEIVTPYHESINLKYNEVVKRIENSEHFLMRFLSGN